MPKARGSAKSAPSPTRGGYRLNGSWDDEASHNTPLTEFVKGMQRERRSTTMTPAEFVQRIPGPFLRAFPTHEFWASCHSWFSVRCATSAESTVAYAFIVRGSPALEPEGEESVSAADDVASLVRSLVGAFSPTFSMPRSDRPINVGSVSGPAADAEWFKRNAHRVRSMQRDHPAAVEASFAEVVEDRRALPATTTGRTRLVGPPAV